MNKNKRIISKKPKLALRIASRKPTIPRGILREISVDFAKGIGKTIRSRSFQVNYLAYELVSRAIGLAGGV